MARQAFYSITNTPSNGIAGIFKMTFADGSAPIELDTGLLSREIIAQALLHGLKQKVVDAGALPCDPDTGRSASIGDKISAMQEVAERIASGAWNASREGGSGATGGLLARALVEHTGKSAEAIKGFLSSKNDKEKAALRVNPKIAAIIDRMKAEAGKSTGIDSDGLLDELM